jgi:5-methylcytosine-specific restriction endonuclease McrA
MTTTTGKLGIVRCSGDDMTNLRRRVFFRDGYRCVRCGRPVTWNTGELAHIVPRGCGGSDTDDNVETCCQQCHRDEHQPRAVRCKA